MNYVMRWMVLLVLLGSFLFGSKSVITPPWSPYKLSQYSKATAFDISDTTIKYKINGREDKINFKGSRWEFRYPSKTKESHQKVYQEINQSLSTLGASLLYSDAKRTLYTQENNQSRYYYDIYYGWSYEVRIYVYQEYLLPINQPIPITFKSGENYPKELLYQAQFDGKHYYYLKVEIVEGDGVEVAATPNLEDTPLRIRYSKSKLQCDAKYYKNYTMYDLAPYKATHHFKIKPLGKKATKVNLTLVQTPYRVPLINEISTKPGLLKMHNSLSSLPTIEALGTVLGYYKNEGDYLPNGDAIYWLNNAYYTLSKNNLQTNLIPLLAKHQTTINWPLFYEEFTTLKSKDKSDKKVIKMAIHDTQIQENDNVAVDFSLANLPRDINLSKEDFTTFEAGTIQGNVLSLKRLHEPMNVVILLDSSGSMKKSMRLALQSVQKFINKLPQDAKVELVDFDTSVKPLKAKNRKELLQKLNAIKANGATALYDSIIKAIELQKDKKRASIVLFTDGKDANYNDTKRGSKVTFETMMAKVQSSPIPIYPIAFGDNADTTTLTTIAKLTKTTYYQGKQKEKLDGIFEDIATTLSNSYRLIYQRGKMPQNGNQAFVNYMVDVSGSQDLRYTMQTKCEGCGYRYEPLKSMLAQSIEALPKESFVQLSVFSNEVKTLQIVTQDKARLLSGVGAMKIGGGTDILKAIKKGFELAKVIPSNRRYFIFVTDAAADAFKFDEEQKKELNAALLAFKQNSIATFWLGMVESDQAKKEVQNLANISGGEAFVSADIAKISDKILEVTQKVNENNITTSTNTSITLKLKRRNEKSGAILTAVSEKLLDVPVLKESIASKTIEDIAYTIKPYDLNQKSYNPTMAQKIYGDDLPLNEVRVSKIIPLQDENNRSITAQNDALSIELKTAYLFDRLKGVRARHNERFLVLDMSLRNLLKAQSVVVLEDGSKYPSSWLNRDGESYKTIQAIPSYKISDLRRHLFVRINNEHEIPFESITWALNKPLVELDEHQLLVEANITKEGVLAFAVPNTPIKTLSLHLYDTAYGHLDIPIIGKLTKTHQEITKLAQEGFTKLSDNFALRVNEHNLSEEIKGIKASDEAIFQTLDISLQSKVNALLKLDSKKRVFIKIKTPKGDVILPTHVISKALPMGLYQDIALAPGSNNRFKVAFHIPKALKDNPKSLLIELKNQDVEIALNAQTIKKESKTLANSKAEGIAIDINGIYQTKRGNIAVDFTLHDTQDGSSTRLHEALVMSKYDSIKSFATIVDSNKTIQANKKGLSSFSTQSELKGAYKWIAPSSKSIQKIVGYESNRVIYDGTSGRFVVLFDKNKLQKDKANYLISPIFKELSLPIEKPKKLPQELEYLLTDKLEYDAYSHYDKEVYRLIKTIRMQKVAEGKNKINKLPTLGLHESTPIATVIDPLPISLMGAKKLEKIKGVESMIRALKKLEWVPAVKEQNYYSTAAIFTQGWGNEYEMAHALHKQIQTSHTPIETGYYPLTQKGKNLLKQKANGIPFLDKVPYIKWGEEDNQKSMVVPFFQSIEELSELIDTHNGSLSASLFHKENAHLSVKLVYESKKESASMQIGGMGGALSGNTASKPKKITLLKKYFLLTDASNMPIDVWFTQGKNKEGKPTINSSYYFNQGVEHESVVVKNKILPKALEITLYNGNNYLDSYTFDFKKGQSIDELFLTFAFAMPEISQKALELIESKRKELFKGVKEVDAFSKLQWANRAKIYNFIALQTQNEKHLQQILSVNAKRHLNPMAMMAMIEKTPDNKLISSLDLRHVFNDVYGEKNAVQSFNVMSGLFNAQAEAKVAPKAKGIYAYWKEYQNPQMALINRDNKKAMMQKMQDEGIKPSIIERLKQSKKVWIFPFGVKKNIAWFEVDRESYNVTSVLESGLYGSTTEQVIVDTLVREGTNYAAGFLGGLVTAEMTVISVSLMFENYDTILKVSEVIASSVACALSVATASSTSDVVKGPLACLNGSAMRSGDLMEGIVKSGWSLAKGKTNDSVIKSTLGFANGFGDAVTYYFSKAKEAN